MRSCLLFIALLAASSAATAAAHYTEVWNPPEARAFQPHARAPGHSASRARKLAKDTKAHAEADHKATRGADHKVLAGPAHLAKRAPVGAPVVLRPVAPSGKRVDIPPRIGPDGQVLWVRGDSVLFG